MDTTASVVVGTDAQGWQEAHQWAGAFLAGYASPQTRRSYRRDMDCWFAPRGHFLRWRTLAQLQRETWPRRGSYSGLA